MNTYSGSRSSRPAVLFSFGFLDGLQVRLRQPHLREAPAGFGLNCLVTIFMNNPGYRLTVCKSGDARSKPYDFRTSWIFGDSMNSPNFRASEGFFEVQTVAKP